MLFHILDVLKSLPYSFITFPFFNYHLNFKVKFLIEVGSKSILTQQIWIQQVRISWVPSKNSKDKQLLRQLKTSNIFVPWLIVYYTVQSTGHTHTNELNPIVHCSYIVHCSWGFSSSLLIQSGRQLNTWKLAKRTTTWQCIIIYIDLYNGRPFSSNGRVFSTGGWLFNRGD